MTGLRRQTGETEVEVRIGAADQISADTTDPFLDHMLVTLARYSGLGVQVLAKGDLPHHLIEDVAITLGLALKEHLPATAARYGWCVLPMDDALVEVSLDLGGRAWYEGPLPDGMYDHFFQSLAFNLAATLHVRVLRGRDEHHVVEAAIKALGMALRQALADSGAVFSTKGSVQLESLD